jgi:hypothetical protein
MLMYEFQGWDSLFISMRIVLSVARVVPGGARLFMAACDTIVVTAGNLYLGQFPITPFGQMQTIVLTCGDGVTNKMHPVAYIESISLNSSYLTFRCNLHKQIFVRFSTRNYRIS